MKAILLLTFLTCLASGCATPHAKTRAPIWYLPAEDTAVYGVSVVYNPVPTARDIRSTTYGIRLDPIGIGFLIPLMPSVPFVDEDTEQFLSRLHEDAKDNTYGLDLSLTGSAILGNVYGISVGLIANFKNELQGGSATVMWNLARKATGLQCAMWNAAHTMNGMQVGIGSQTVKLHGMQVGLINIAGEGRGLQVGLWNVNNRRSLPLINWVSPSIDE